MKKFIKSIVLGMALLFSLTCFVDGAQKKQFDSWNAIIDQMDIVLNQSYDSYFKNDIEGAKALVNDAYFGYYEKYGVERSVMSYISGARGSATEYQFALIKRLMTNQAPNKEVRAAIDDILKVLHEDANTLDGKKESGWSVFLASLIILLREGTEAILVIAAIVAYLVRSGNKPMVRTVYLSSLVAIIASIIAAIAIHSLLEINGANQEMMEGAAMLLATVVLFFVSNWMFSKAEAEAWKGYVEGKVQSAISTSSGLALGFAAFLAVFREGAETILFYQAILADAKDHNDMVWYGFAAATIILVAIFALIRFGSLKLPIKPFFIGTSILMYIMAIAFAGGGVKELQEADIITVTPVNFIGAVDILGIYPTVETLIPQAFMVLIVVISILYYKTKNRKLST